jgi:GntR family transcriptional repressor for pyruvate dehydrogenase complex
MSPVRLKAVPDPTVDVGSDASRPEPVRRTALYEEVVNHLVRFIAGCGLEPGQKLPAERDLARELGVSRTSVRQGLTVLRVSGLVEVRHGLGVYLLRHVHDTIPPISPEILVDSPDLPAVHDVREALETHAARLAAVRRTDADLAELALANDQMQREIEAGHPGLDGDRRFHAAIVQASASPILAELLASVRPTIVAEAAASLARIGQPPRSLTTHRLIFESIVRMDVEEAGRLMLDHLSVTGAIGVEQPT